MTAQTADSAKHYVPSGRVAWHAPLKVLIYGGAAAAVLSLIYTLIIRYNPLIYFSCLATFAFGGLLGLAAVKASEAGLSRSRAFNAGAGLTLAAFGLWLHWILWTWLMYANGADLARQLATSGPKGWHDFLVYTSEHRHLSVGRLLGSSSGEESPTFMRWTWGLEAFAVMLLATLAACVSQRPFSERTMKWAAADWEGELALNPTSAPDSRQIEQVLDRDGVAWLATLGRVVDDKAPGVRLRLSCLSVAGDPACAFISLSRVTQRGEKGKVVSGLVSNRRVDAAAYQQLVARLKQPG